MGRPEEIVADLQRLASLGGLDADVLISEVGRLKAEVKRLRGVLSLIERSSLYELRQACIDCKCHLGISLLSTRQMMIQLARQALKDKEVEG